MTIGAGSLSLRRLRVLRSPLENKLPQLVEQMRKHRIRPMGIDEAKEEVSGWCHPFSGEPDFRNPDKLVYDNAFIFGLRTDSKRVPGTLFRLQLKAALEELEKRAPKERGERPRLAKKLKDAARDRIKTELLKRTLPNIRLVEIIWHLDSNEIWLLSQGTSVLEHFEKLFNETFALPFVHINAGTAAVDFDRIQKGEETKLKKLLELVPQSILSQDRIRDDGDEKSEEAPF